MNLTDEQLAIWRQLTEAGEADFSALVSMAGLDPAHDFRGADLSDVDFGTADLRGFDFEEADLTNADLSRARVTLSTIHKAQIAGARLPASFQLNAVQIEVLSAIIRHLRQEHRRALVSAPPGSGVSRLVAELLDDFLRLDRRNMVLVLTSTRAETAQLRDRLGEQGLGRVESPENLVVGAPAARIYATEYRTCARLLKDPDHSFSGVLRNGGFSHVVCMNAESPTSDELTTILQAAEEAIQVAFEGGQAIHEMEGLREHFAGSEVFVLRTVDPADVVGPAPEPDDVGESARLADHPDAVAHSALILALGPRAARIANAAKSPEWLPAWSATKPGALGFIRRGGVRKDAPGPWIEVRSMHVTPASVGYGVVVILADDEVLADPARREDALEHGRRFAGPRGVLVIAPALPEDEPSGMLRADGSASAYGADLLLDTSLARSPCWGPAERHSLDRRIADLILGAALICLPGSRIHDEIAARAGDPKIPRIASLAIWDRDLFQDEDSRRAPFLSEANVPREGDVWLDEPVPLNGRRRRPLAAHFQIGGLRPDFDEYVAAMLRRFEATDQVRHGELWGGGFEAPSRLRSALRDPQLTAAFRVPGPAADYCLLTAETPTIQALEEGRRSGWLIARATDASGIRRILAPEGSRAAMPTEVVLPRLRRFSANRRLATRGADTRDIVKLPRHSHEGDAVESHLILRDLARPYLTGSGQRDPNDVALPVHELERMAANDRLAADLLARLRTRGATARRLADLAVLWSPSENRRFLVEDGRLPPNVLEVPPDMVPAQAWFAVEGDGSVPVLLGSCLFAVWARMTRSRGTGWTQRFAISRTFETFPIIAPFETVESAAGAVMLIVHDFGPLKPFSRALARHIEMPPDSRDQEDYRRRIREDADAALLGIYGLPPDAAEFDIAQRLLDLNRSLPDEAPSRRPTFLPSEPD